MQTEFQAFLQNTGLIGVDASPGNDLVVSLTSYPPRMAELHYCLLSLLTQLRKPGKVLLWLAEEEFPGRERSVPEKTLQLRAKGLEIRWTANTRPYKKLVPALQEYGAKVIVTADDDALYPPGWLDALYADYLDTGQRNMVYAHRGHEIVLSPSNKILPYLRWKLSSSRPGSASFLNFATGVGGILYPPGCLHEDATDVTRFMRLSPLADDLYFWAMAVINGTRIRIVRNNLPTPNGMNNCDGDDALYKINMVRGMNDKQLANLLSFYPEIMERIMDERLLPSGETESFNSAAYWEKRYEAGGNSGVGSYNRLIRFKADTINAFLEEHAIQTVIDFGVGDGNQLAALTVKNYLGVDVSPSVLARLQPRYAEDSGKAFIHLSEYQGQQAELTLSLDVVYHLVEDDIFHDYMARLFDASSRYVIVYSSNTDAGEIPSAAHVKHRKFTRWVSRHRPEWQCIRFIKNKYPLRFPGDEQIRRSFSDFYIFERKNRAI